MAKILKQKAREFFDQTKKVTCPAFPKEKVYFNAKGLNHIFYKGSRKGRTKQQVATKVRLLPHAVEILKAMPLPQEQGEYLKGKKKYKFWAFEGVIRNRRVKVIVRQIGGGRKHFWSVIPAWRKSRFGVRNARSNLSKQ